MKENVESLLREYGFTKKQYLIWWPPLESETKLVWFSCEVDVPTTLIVQLKLMEVDFEKIDMADFNLKE